MPDPQPPTPPPPTVAPLRPLYTVPEAAAELRISRAQLDLLIGRGEIASLVIGRRARRITGHALADYLARLAAAPVPVPALTPADPDPDPVPEPTPRPARRQRSPAIDFATYWAPPARAGMGAARPRAAAPPSR